MGIMILITMASYISYQNKVDYFINNSTEQIIIIEDAGHMDKGAIKEKLRRLTHQEVEIKDMDDKIYINIKCPPEKRNYFIKWLSDKKWEE